MEQLKKQLKLYIDNNLIQEKREKKGLFSKIKYLYMEDCCDADFENIESSYEIQRIRESSNIKDFIDKHELYNNFQTMLFKLIFKLKYAASEV